MGDKSYFVVATTKGHEKIDFSIAHDPKLAKEMLILFQRNRYIYKTEGNGYNTEKDDLLIFSNKNGTIIINDDLAVEFAFDGNNKLAKDVSKNFNYLLATAYYTACTVDAFSLYENGNLRRHVCYIDGLEDKVEKVGELLDEEIEFILQESKNFDPIDYQECLEYDDFYDISEYIIEGKKYTIEGLTALGGGGTDIEKRFFNIGLDCWMAPNYSIFNKKPWWKRW